MLLVGIVTIVGLLISVQGVPALCPRGKFGLNCAFSCHCRTSATCAWNGQCPNNDSCERGYFGPACQYVDLLQLYPAPLVPASVYDGDDSTCVRGQKSSKIVVTLSVSSALSWIRILTYNKHLLLNFTLKINDNISCPHERKYVFSETMVDIPCGFIGRIRSLTVEGPLVFFICSIHLSSGRNVALFQNVTASSVNKEHHNKSLPKFMVDGDTGGDWTRHGCTCTELEAKPWIVLTFSPPVVLYSIRIYNRADADSDRLLGFKLEISDATRQFTLGYEDHSPMPRLRYYISLPEPVVVASIRIYTWKKQYLTVCELEAFGDIPCHNNTFGFICQNRCQCDEFHACNEITGACGVACPAHLYGIDCNLQCPENCHSNCTWRTGRCGRCVPGFLGDFCRTACPTGSYGQGCAFNCSKRCQAPCHHVTGICNCPTGYSGPGCTDAVKGSVFGWLAAAILAGITIVCCCPFFLRRRQNRKAQPLPEVDQQPEILEEEMVEMEEMVETAADNSPVGIKEESPRYDTCTESLDSWRDVEMRLHSFSV